jgi:hypothetical protein
MKLTGGCHCGAIRYAVDGDAIVHALCHCIDCRKHAGAPTVGWAMFKVDDVKVTKGAPKTYASSTDGRRQFCPECGTGLFYLNDNILPGIIDVQSNTLDDPALLPPQIQVQVADRLDWMKTAHELPAFERYPPQG